MRYPFFLSARNIFKATAFYGLLAGGLFALGWWLGGLRLGSVFLVVSHGGPIRAIQAAAAGRTVHEFRRVAPVEPNAGLTRVAVRSGRISRLD